MKRRTTPSDSQRTPPEASSVREAVVSGWESGVNRTPHHMGILNRNMARSPAISEMRTLLRSFIENSVHSVVSNYIMDEISAGYTTACDFLGESLGRGN